MFLINELIVGLQKHLKNSTIVTGLPQNYKNFSDPWYHIDLGEDNPTIMGDNKAIQRTRIYYIKQIFSSNQFQILETNNALEIALRELKITYSLDSDIYNNKPELWERTYRIELKKIN